MAKLSSGAVDGEEMTADLGESVANSMISRVNGKRLHGKPKWIQSGSHLISGLSETDPYAGHPCI